MDADGSKAVPLWHIGTKRCNLTPVASGPPFSVLLYDGDILLSSEVFNEHDQAAARAVEALRAATAPDSSASES